MVLDIRVKVLCGDYFRPRLSYDDIVYGNGEIVDVASSNDLLISSDGINYVEEALVFINSPIVVPNMTYLYSSRLFSLNVIGREMLRRVVMDLCFLNPNINDLGIKKMASWIVSYYVKHDSDLVPLISFDSIVGIVSSFVDEFKSIGDISIIQSDRVIFYKKNSLLTSEDKRYYSRFYRNVRVGGLWGELIHASAILASEKIDPLKVVTSSDVIAVSNKIKNHYRFNKYVEDRTIDLLTDINVDRKFVTERTVDKFYKYLELSNNTTVNEISKKLGLSFSTLKEFKRVKKNRGL